MRFIALILTMTLASATAGLAQAPAAAKKPAAHEVGLSYNWMRTNAQPGGCGCFAINGGGINAAVAFNNHFSAVVEFDAETRAHAPATGNSLTLTSVHGGLRYYIASRAVRHNMLPFFEVLPGAAHVGGAESGSGDGTIQFSGRAGGGLDVPLARHFNWRMVEVDYDLTTFSNGSTDRQNNLLASSGFTFRW